MEVGVVHRGASQPGLTSCGAARLRSPPRIAGGALVCCCRISLVRGQSAKRVAAEELFLDEVANGRLSRLREILLDLLGASASKSIAVDGLVWVVHIERGDPQSRRRM